MARQNIADVVAAAVAAVLAQSNQAAASPLPAWVAEAQAQPVAKTAKTAKPLLTDRKWALAGLGTSDSGYPTVIYSGLMRNGNRFKSTQAVDLAQAIWDHKVPVPGRGNP